MREGSTRCARQPTRGQSSTRQVVSGLSPVVKPRKCLEEVGAAGGRAPHTMQMNAGASWAQSKIWGRGCRGSARQQPFRNLTKRGLHRLCAPTETSNRAEAGHSTPAAAAAAEAPAAAGGRFQGRRGSRLCSHGGRVAGTGCAKKGDAWKGDGPKGEEVGACTRPKGLVVWVPRVTRPKGVLSAKGVRAARGVLSGVEGNPTSTAAVGTAPAGGRVPGRGRRESVAEAATPRGRRRSSLQGLGAQQLPGQGWAEACTRRSRPPSGTAPPSLGLGPTPLRVALPAGSASRVPSGVEDSPPKAKNF